MISALRVPPKCRAPSACMQFRRNGGVPPATPPGGCGHFPPRLMLPPREKYFSGCVPSRAMHATLPSRKARSPDRRWRLVTVTSLKGGCGSWRKRMGSAVEGTEEEVGATRSAELASAAVEGANGAGLVAAAVVTNDASLVSTAVVAVDACLIATVSSRRCLLAPSARACCSASRARAVSWVASPEARSASRASASVAFRRSASSSAVAKTFSTAAMSARRRAETCASISETLLVVSVQFAATAALKDVGRDAHVSWGARSMGRTGPDGACSEGLLLYALPLLLSQVLLPQPRLFLKFLACLLLYLVGRGPLLLLSPVGRGPLLPLFVAGRRPLLLLSGGVNFQLSVLGAWELKVDVPQWIETGNSQRRAVLRGRARPTAARRRAVLSLLGGRPARARRTIVRHGLKSVRGTRRGRVQRRLVGRQN